VTLGLAAGWLDTANGTPGVAAAKVARLAGEPVYLADTARVPPPISAGRE